MGIGNHLKKAKDNVDDEYYTKYEDIESEISNYTDFLKGKVVYCNCDDYRISNFVKYFKNEFETLKLKKLISTNYDIGDGAYQYEYDGHTENVTEIENGSFDSENNLRILREDADIVITNPPFSLYTKYLPVLITSGKYYLIIGGLYSVAYHSIFPYYYNKQLGFSYNKSKTGSRSGNRLKFYKQDGTEKFICSFWFTNISDYEPQFITPTKEYVEGDYKRFDNAPHIIEIGSKKNIPYGYDGEMAIPLSTLPFINRNQYEIIGQLGGAGITEYNRYGNPVIDGKIKFHRIIIKEKQ